MRSDFFLRGVPAAFLAAVLILFLAGTARSLAQQVTSTADSGAGTLRNTLASAANGATITFAPGLSGTTITLASTLAISQNLTIDASALTGGIQISGNGSVQIFNVASSITVLLNSLTLTGGSIGTNGGAIQNSGTLTLTNCTLSGNTSKSAFGGAIGNNGTLTMNDCIVSNNNAHFDGGGIYNGQGTVTLNQCTLSGNYAVLDFGGGIQNQAAVFEGAAIGYVDAGSMTLNQCTLSGNTSDEGGSGSLGGAGGGIYNLGILTLNQCTVSGNSAIGSPASFGDSGGGGIYHDWGTLTLNQCTFSGNTAHVAGGIYDGAGTAALNQCTISGNTAVLAGGGVEATAGTAAITNCIVAVNSASLGADIFYLTNVFYGGSNLVQSATNINNEGTAYGPAPLTNAPDLAAPGYYGGPTQTMPPLPGSPALGAGSVAANIFTTDQRGFPRVVNSLVDIGAVEVQLPAANPPVLRNLRYTGGALQFNFTNTPVADFSVLTTTNVALPLTHWTVLGEVMQPAPGQYQFTDLQPATNSVRVYRVRSP